MKSVACYSNKGGVGKTATAVNMARALAAAGRRVLLCDLDPQGASSFYFRVKPSKTLKEDRLFTSQRHVEEAIRGSDFDGLDILPSNMEFRDFDVFLSRMKKSRSRLGRALAGMEGAYDIVLLDCPPNISLLSENVFAAADAILVPVIPTTLSERTFEQLLEFFRDRDIPRDKILGFFSMVQATKKLHGETMASMLAAHPKRLMQIVVPFCTEVERMGIHRAPVASFAASSPAVSAYARLSEALETRLGPDG